MVQTRAAALKLASKKRQDQPDKGKPVMVSESRNVHLGQVQVDVALETERAKVEGKAAESIGDLTIDAEIASIPDKKRRTKRSAESDGSPQKSAKRARKRKAPKVRGGWDVLPHGMGVLSTRGALSDSVSDQCQVPPLWLNLTVNEDYAEIQWHLLGLHFASSQWGNTGHDQARHEVLVQSSTRRDTRGGARLDGKISPRKEGGKVCHSVWPKPLSSVDLADSRGM